MNSFLFLNCKITHLKMIIEREQSSLIGKLNISHVMIHLIWVFPKLK